MTGLFIVSFIVPIVVIVFIVVIVSHAVVASATVPLSVHGGMVSF
jgi:hypothetical protein